jgi:AraC family transcriptional regulator, ethanolamine operon transcriptional activator
MHFPQPKGGATVDRPKETPARATAAPAFVVVQDIDDPCVWELASRPWELLAAPIGRGPFRNRKQCLVTPHALLYRECFAGGVRVQGMSPAGMLGWTVPIRLGGGSRYWGAALHEQGIPASLPGAVDACMDAGQEHLIVLAQLDWLRGELDPATARILERHAARRVLPATAGASGALATWLCRLLDRVHAAPRVLAHPAAVSAIDRALLARLLRSLPLAELADPGERRDGSTLSQRGFERAIEHLRVADLGTLSAAALCTQVGVSQRTLEYAFRERFGTSPMELIRRMRLHAVRRALLAEERQCSTVTDLAMSFGFYQLGRFAADYRAIFGELPSATLARRCTYTGASLLG